MKSLVLIRHAKSDWTNNTADIDRTITASGRIDAHRVASGSLSFLPPNYAVWSSIARRAYETCLIFTDVFSYPNDQIQFLEPLYTFEVNVLERIIRSAPESLEALIVFGHNEAITEFVNKFGDIYIDNVPTAGLVTITFDTNSWNTIRKGHTGRVILPRDLRT